MKNGQRKMKTTNKTNAEGFAFPRLKIEAEVWKATKAHAVMEELSMDEIVRKIIIMYLKSKNIIDETYPEELTKEYLEARKSFHKKYRGGIGNTQQGD